MRSFIIVAILCLISSALAGPYEDFKHESNVYEDQCRKQESDSNNVQFSGQSKCFYAYFYEKFGFLKDNVVQEEVFLQKIGAILGREIATKALGECQIITDEDRCETGGKFDECLTKTFYMANPQVKQQKF